jgi:preprotein translocase subunit SecE
VARNRKRAKERRARRPQPAQVARPGAAARADLEEAPSPLEHSAPDAELAEAQLALGRAELAGATEVQTEPGPGVAGGPPAEPGRTESEADDFDQAEADELEQEATAAAPRSGARQLATIDTEGGAVAQPRRVPGNRLIHFLQGSWHELQRVQWPDRRQVVQATGVVIGFVLIAGVFLGVADAVAGKLMNFILK